MLFMNEACKMAAVCGASFMLGSVWMLVQRLASAHIRYITARALRLEPVSANLHIKQNQQSCCEAADALPCSDILPDSQNSVTRRSIINFYLAHGRKLNPTEIDSFVVMERYRRESNLNMSNLKIFDYILGEFTEKPLKNVLVANDVFNVKNEKMLLKNNMMEYKNKTGLLGSLCLEKSCIKTSQKIKNNLLKDKEDKDVENTKYQG